MSVLGSIPPGAFLSILLGTVYGSLGHLVLGRRFLHLPLFLLSGIGGCLIAWSLHLQLLHRYPMPGGFPIVEGSIVAWLLLTLVGIGRRS